LDLAGVGGADDPDTELLSEYLALTLHALQAAAKKDRWIYVCEEETGGVWRFWPQRPSARDSWQVEPIPNGEDVMFASRDFKWGVYGASQVGDPRWWTICVFGERMLAAFAKQQPRAFSHPISNATYPPKISPATSGPPRS
jgi:hypothetical protein